ncbi:MAG: GNAT family N-acetyltransferase [Ignavibacteriaceae bacterium]|nr:GNAT family N-acetyltransferase [Ignavibacteriaceae bacterium]
MHKIDISEVILKKNPNFLGWMPRLFRKTALYLIGKVLIIDKINTFRRENSHKNGIDFIDEAFDYLDFSYTISKRDRDRIKSEGRVVIVANHPLGGLDGLALVKLVSEIRPDVKVVVNDFLANLSNLNSVFLPFDITFSRPQKSNFIRIKETLLKESAVIFFPAGKVSRFRFSGIKDDVWHKGFLHFARQTNSPILPVHITAKNSFFFYMIGAISDRLSMLLLAREIYNKKGKTIEIKVGEIIPFKAVEDIKQEKVALKLLKKHVNLIGKGKRGIFRTERNIIHPVNRQLLKRELLSNEMLGRTSDNKLMLLLKADHNENVMNEIGRLRELTFRKVGEGTGRKSDTDLYDKTYKHLVLWDEEALEIVGSYRLGFCEEILGKSGPFGLYTASLFNFSDVFLETLPQSIELGRSFVQSRYWNTNALDYLWQGLGAILAKNPGIRYLFGPVSLSNSYSEYSKNLIIHFYKKWFSGTNNLVTAKNRFIPSPVYRQEFSELFNNDDYKKELLILKKVLKNNGFAVPTLYKQYTEVTEAGGSAFLDFGIDPDFGDCIDGLIQVDITKIKPGKRDRYLGKKAVEEYTEVLV